MEEEPEQPEQMEEVPEQPEQVEDGAEQPEQVEEVPEQPELIPQYFAPTAAEGLELIGRLPGTRMELIVPRSMPTQEYRALQTAALQTPVDHLGHHLVTLHNPRVPLHEHPYYKVIGASTVEDLSAFPDEMEREVVVCISQNIPADLYYEIAEEAELRRLLVACSYPQNRLHPHPQYHLPPQQYPPSTGLSLSKTAFILGGCITVGGLLLFLHYKLKQEHSAADDLPKTHSTSKNLQKSIARACKPFMRKMLTKVLKKVAKEIAIWVLESLENEENEEDLDDEPASSYMIQDGGFSFY